MIYIYIYLFLLNREYMSSMSIFENEYYKGGKGIHPSCRLRKIIPMDVFPNFFVQHYYPIRWNILKKHIYQLDAIKNISMYNLSCNRWLLHVRICLTMKVNLYIYIYLNTCAKNSIVYIYIVYVLIKILFDIYICIFFS